MPKRIAVLITNNFEDQEYLEPVAALLAAHHSVCNIELNAGKVVYGLHGCSAVTIDRGIEQISIDDFDALLIPGANLRFLSLPMFGCYSSSMPSIRPKKLFSVYVMHPYYCVKQMC